MFRTECDRFEGWSSCVFLMSILLEGAGTQFHCYTASSPFFGRHFYTQIFVKFPNKPKLGVKCKTNLFHLSYFTPEREDSYAQADTINSTSVMVLVGIYEAFVVWRSVAWDTSMAPSLITFYKGQFINKKVQSHNKLVSTWCQIFACFYFSNVRIFRSSMFNDTVNKTSLGFKQIFNFSHLGL